MSKPGIKKLEKWSKGKPKYLVLLAMTILPHAEMMSWFLKQLAQRHKLSQFFSDPDPDAWLSFYKSQKAWSKQLCRDTGLTIANGLDLVDYLDGLKKVAREYKVDPEGTRSRLESQFSALSKSELQTLWYESEQMWQGMLQESFVEAISEELSEQESDEIEAYVMYDSVQFLVRVWLPCWILHQKQPGMLYSKARRGDLLSLDQLLRIDKTRVSDPAIMRHCSESAYGPDSTNYAVLTEAITGKPHKIPKSSKIKARLSALVSQWSKLGGHHIETSEIRRLYDIIAGIKKRGSKDLEMRPTPEAFMKAVSREPKWPPFVADKS